MIDLKQKELKAWQDKNFPPAKYEKLTKAQLIDMIITLQVTLGMAEEVGEICHNVLKGCQGIRGGVDGVDKNEVADGVADVLIYGMQLLSQYGLIAEKEIPKVIGNVLDRDWVKNPDGAGF